MFVLMFELDLGGDQTLEGSTCPMFFVEERMAQAFRPRKEWF